MDTSESSKVSMDKLETFRNSACFFSTFTYLEENNLWNLKEKRQNQWTKIVKENEKKP